VVEPSGRLVRAGGAPALRDELADVSGSRLIVETRRMRSGSWNTTICPGDAPSPDGPEALLFATCPNAREAFTAHAQAVDFTAMALNTTIRRHREVRTPRAGLQS
jgi:hypothetical protein